MYLTKSSFQCIVLFVQMYLFSEKNQHVCSCVSDHMCGYCQTVLRPVFNTIYGISSFIEARRSKATSVEVQSTATEMVPMNSLESESSVTNSSHLWSLFSARTCPGWFTWINAFLRKYKVKFLILLLELRVSEILLNSTWSQKIGEKGHTQWLVSGAGTGSQIKKSGWWQACFFNVLLPTARNKFAEISSLAEYSLSLARIFLSLAENLLSLAKKPFSFKKIPWQ